MKKTVKVTIIFTLMFLFVEVLPQLNAQEKGVKTQGGKSEETSEDLSDYSRPTLKYDPGEKRDPFKTLVPKTVDEEKKIKGLFNYENATLKGVVNADGDSYSMVVDADGFGYVLREGYRVFGGYVTRITDDAVHLHIVKYGRSMSIIMRLESSKSAVIVEKELGESFTQKPGISIIYSRDVQSSPKIMIEDVLVPSLDIKTLDELWFGSQDTVPVTGESEAEDSVEEAVVSFSLIDPSDDTWISLPYVLDWTTPKVKDINYILYIDDDSDFSSPLFVKEGITTSSFLLGEDTGLPSNKRLFWKIIAQDESGLRVACRRTDMSFKVIGKK